MPKQNPYKKPTYNTDPAPRPYTPPPTSSSGGYTGTSYSGSGYSSSSHHHRYGYHDTEKAAKICCILIPILALVIGQIVQYVVYFKSGSVLLFDVIFNNIPLWPLIVSSVIAIIDIILVIVKTWNMADEGDDDKTWPYFIVASLLVGVIPCVISLFGIIAIPLINHWIEESDEEYIGYIAVGVPFIIGQVAMWVSYSRTGEILVLSNLVSASGNTNFNILTFSIISSIVLAIASIIVAIEAGMFELPGSLCAFVPFAVFSGVLPALMGIPLIVYAIILTIVAHCATDEDKAGLITSIVSFSLIVILSITFGIIAAVSPSASLDGYNLQTIKDFNEISDKVNQETVALDISTMSGDNCRAFTTGSDCETLILVGNSKITYKNMSITTSASEVVLRNIKITGTITFNANECILTIYGYNSVLASNGSAGGTGQRGTDGSNAVKCNNLIFSGNGTLELTPGDGGNGGHGAKGDDAFLFGSGGRGGNGGNGGSSGYAIYASSTTNAVQSQDFTGKLILHQGKAGSGGAGGKGGSGALFGSNGANGYSGSSGTVRPYSNVTINVYKKNIESK